MNEDNRDPDPTTMSRKALIDEVIRLRAQVAEDQDYYRKCRDMMADKLQSYNEKFNMQEEVIADLSKQIENNKVSTKVDDSLYQRETTRVPQLPRLTFAAVPAFDGYKVF